MEHPARAYHALLKSLRWDAGRVYEDHQHTRLYIMPAGIVQEVRLELRETVGSKVAGSILYEFNRLSADAIVRDARGIGFKGRDLARYFFAIMALFGWGFVTEFELDEDSGRGTLVLENFPKSARPQREAVHDDFRGIFARALELVYGREFSVVETSCCEIDGSRDTCIYDIRPRAGERPVLGSGVSLTPVEPVDAKAIPKNREFRNLVKRISMPENGVLVLDDAHGGERVVIKDVASINSMVLKTADLIGWKTVGGALFRVGREHGLRGFGDARLSTIDDIKAHLELLGFFGWGLVELAPGGGGKYNISVKNSPFVEGIPPDAESGVCLLLKGVLSGMFEKVTGKRVRVEEVECVAKGDASCRFSIEMLT
ncbi:MAG: V4R domain-containing protein [Promethearchaeota archaeon]